MWGKPKNLLTKNMAIYIEMPKLSDTMTEGTLLKWLKAEGSKVETGDVLAEIDCATGTSFYTLIPGEGVLASVGIYAFLPSGTVTTTIFYG